MQNSEIYVIKRNGSKEEVHFEKVQTRIKLLSNGLSVSPNLVAQRVCTRIYDGVSTAELDELAGQICTSLMTEHPDYGILATRIVISNNHKITPDKFSDSVKILYLNTDSLNNHNPLVSKELYNFVLDNEDLIDSQIIHERDYLIDYFGLKTLQKGYLLKCDNKIVERPQYMFMRVSLGLHGSNLQNAFNSYHLLSQKYFCHATPTLFHSGTPRPQLLSCFLLGTEDSVDGIYKNVSDCAKISKWAGGIGVHVNNIRGRNAYIRSSNGHSSGIVPMLRVYNETAKYVNQCFTPETLIITSEGQKEIQKIQVGDYVLTKNGEFKTVLQIHKSNVNKEILKIKSYSSFEDIRVTPEHRIFVKRINDFVFADELIPGDFVALSVPFMKMIDEFPDEPEFFYIYGALLADGYITKDEAECGLYLKNRDNVFNNICNYFNRVKYPYIISPDNVLRWKNTVFTYADIYDKNGHKRVADEYFKMSNKKMSFLLKGVIDMGIVDDLTFNTCHRLLAHNVQYFLLCLGEIVEANVYGDDLFENDLEYRKCYSIKLPKTKFIKELTKIDFNFEENKFERCNNHFWVPIQNISKENYSGLVYDLTIRDNHNYVISSFGVVHNSGKRNGSIAIYLEPYHPDIMDFLDLRKNNGSEDARTRDLFTALMIPDLFMKRVEEATKNPDKVVIWSLFDPDKCPGLSDSYGEDFDKLYENYEKKGFAKETIEIGKVWKKIMSSQIETGTPYILFKDQINRMSNQSNIGTIKSSNLCVSGESLIISDSGFKFIGESDGKTLNVWNGYKFCSVEIKQTGALQEMDKIKFSNGEELVCTPYHKFHIQDEIIECKNLLPGMKIKKFNFPIINFENNNFPEPYIHGLWCSNSIDIANGKIILRSYPLELPQYAKNILSKYIVPIEYTVDIRLKWLAGLIDGFNNKIISGGFVFLKDVKKLLNTLGTDAKIYNKRDFLEISSYKNLIKLGLRTNIVRIENRPDSHEYIEVEEIIRENSIEDSYCFEEKENHTGVFNSIMTGQCAEIVEYSDKDEYACCCLASISLGEFVEVKKIEGHVKIYSKTGCPYCDKALELLPKDCEKIVLDDDNERKEFYNSLSKCEDGVCYIRNKKFNTVPQIFIGDKHIGGYTDLVNYLKPVFNFEKLEEVCNILVRNLNKVIDLNFYPVPETARSNFRHRPLGLGVQSFAEMLFKFGYPFESQETQILNKQVFEAIQYYSLKASCQIAKEREEIMSTPEFQELAGKLSGDDRDFTYMEFKGERFSLREINLEKYRGAYSTFNNSPLQKGIFQWEKYGVTDLFLGKEKWNELKKDIQTYGVRNSLLTALMPTASTSQILGNNECFEPITSNIYTRRTLAGDFVVLNKFLVNDLVKDGKWSKELKDLIVAENGSIINLTFLPEKMRELYKTVWEIKQKTLIDLSADRAPFICQTQSLNLFFEEPKVGTLGSALIYGWKRGLKTGSYYIRSRPKVQAQQFTIDPKLKEKFISKDFESCESCSG